MVGGIAIGDAEVALAPKSWYLRGPQIPLTHKKALVLLMAHARWGALIQIYNKP